MKIDALKLLRLSFIAIFFSAITSAVSAGLFDDEEARRAILDLRQRVETIRLEAEQSSIRSLEEVAVLKRSLLDLQNQIEQLKSDAAKQRGVNEQLFREFSEAQRKQKDIVQAFDARFLQFEPIKVNVDGREFLASSVEKKNFDSLSHFCHLLGKNMLHQKDHYPFHLIEKVKYRHHL